MNKLARRAWFTMLLTLILVIGLGVILYRYVTQASQWATYQNSPHLYTNGVMNSGYILDRNDTLLLDTTSGKEYAESESLRKSVLHLLGDTNGNITPYILNAYQKDLVGYDLLNGASQTEADSGRLRLTVSSEIQKAALNALNGQKGTVGVYNYKTGEVLCMVSAPTFDPQNPPDVSADPEYYDGVYLNRFTGGRYAPGSTFKLVTAAAALEEIEDINERTFHCEGSYMIGHQTVVCNSVHGELSFADALTYSCNVAFAQIAVELGSDDLMDFVEDAGITETISFDGFSTEPGNFDLSDTGAYDTAWAGIGQHMDLINPCQFMTFVGAIANGGRAAKPYVVEKVTFGQKERYQAKTELLSRVMEEETANRLAELMNGAVVDYYGEWYFGGFYAGGKTGTAEKGGGEIANALFAGFTQDPDCPLAFIVIIEDGYSGGSACLPVVQQVLNACAAELK